MARYKERSQDGILVPISLAQQLLPDTFEFTLNELIDHHIDLLVSTSSTTTMKPAPVPTLLRRW